MFFLVSYGLTQSCLVPLLTAFPQAFPLFTTLSRVRRAVPLAPQQLFKVEDQGTEPLGQPEQWLLLVDELGDEHLPVGLGILQ